MAKLKIVKDGDELLRKVSRPVTEINQRILTLIDDMTETMRAADGCGLAAVQVGILRRIVLVETEESGLLVLINPEIVSAVGEQNDGEGCLSVPGKWGITKRPERVTVRALDKTGKMREYTGTGLLARAFCHEIDHLDGKLFTDKDVLVRYLSDDELG